MLLQDYATTRFGLDQMKMGWISHNLVYKQKLFQKKIFDRKVSIALINSVFLTHSFAMHPFLPPQTSGSRKASDVFMGYKKGALVTNGLLFIITMKILSNSKKK